MAVKPGSMRARAQGDAGRQGSLFEAPARAQPPRQAPRQEKDARPAGYPDEVLWAMAERFEQQAYKNRVGLGGRGVPFIYKALAKSVDRAGIRKLKCRDGTDKVVHPAELGVRLVDFFWNHAPWDRDGDVISQFADPMMFEDCLEELRRRWRAKRAAARLRDNPLTDNDEVYVRADR